MIFVRNKHTLSFKSLESALLFTLTQFPANLSSHFYFTHFPLSEFMLNLTHTTVIIITTICISLAAWQKPALFNRLIFFAPAIKRGQIDRFVTHGFIHADGWHLFFNMFTLYFFGRVIERLYTDKFGYLGFLAFYLLAIVVASIPDYIKHQNNTQFLSLGASGGVSAVLFVFVLLFPWELIYFFGIIPIPAIVFAILYTAYSLYANKKGGSRINHLAHLTGAAFGILATIIIEPKVILHFLHELLTPRF